MGTIAGELVSVAIISFNQEDYIAECVGSVVAQDYRPIEIIVADDGSSDRTCEIVEAVQRAHPGVITLVRAVENGGITANQNLALAHCTGRYVAWLGGDDVMLPGKLSRQVGLMQSDPNCTICYHDMDVFDSTTGRTLNLFSERVRPRQGDVRVIARQGCFNCGSSTMVRRQPAPERFDPRIRAASDWLFWLQSLAHGGTIRYIDEVLGRYRRHAGNVTGSPVKHRALVLDHVLSAMILLVEHPVLAPDLAITLARQFVSLGRRRRGTDRLSLVVLACLFLAAWLVLRPVAWMTGRRAGALVAREEMDETA